MARSSPIKEWTDERHRTDEIARQVERSVPRTRPEAPRQRRQPVPPVLDEREGPSPDAHGRQQVASLGERAEHRGVQNAER